MAASADEQTSLLNSDDHPGDLAASSALNGQEPEGSKKSTRSNDIPLLNYLGGVESAANGEVILRTGRISF